MSYGFTPCSPKPFLYGLHISRMKDLVANTTNLPHYVQYFSEKKITIISAQTEIQLIQK